MDGDLLDPDDLVLSDGGCLESLSLLPETLPSLPEDLGDDVDLSLLLLVLLSLGEEEEECPSLSLLSSALLLMSWL